MKITSIRYRKLISLPGFENRAIEAEASVEEGETPEDVALSLAAWVHEQLGDKSCSGLDLAALRSERDYLMSQRQQLRDAVTLAKAERDALREKVTALEIRREKAGGEPAMPF